MILFASNSFTLLATHNFSNTTFPIHTMQFCCMLQDVSCMGGVQYTRCNSVACYKMYRVWGGPIHMM